MKSEAENNLMHVLIKCVTACEVCSTACLHEEHAHKMERCIRIDRDCADICALTARWVARDSIHAREMLQMCVNICRECADECRHHDEAHCQKCAQVCEECSQACQEFMEQMMETA